MSFCLRKTPGLVSQESTYGPLAALDPSFLSFALVTAGSKVLKSFPGRLHAFPLQKGYTFLVAIPTTCLNSVGIKVLFVSMPGFYSFIHSLKTSSG